jgi:hypothetical protein
MPQYSALHLEAVYHIFLYLSKHAKSRLVFNDTMPTVDESLFMGDADWNDFMEKRWKRIPQPLCRSVQIFCFVDAGNVVTRRLNTAILIYVQMHQLFGTQRSKVLLSN